MTEAAYSSETMVYTYQTTTCYNPELHNLSNYSHETLKRGRESINVSSAPLYVGIIHLMFCEDRQPDRELQDVHINML